MTENNDTVFGGIGRRPFLKGGVALGTVFALPAMSSVGAAQQADGWFDMTDQGDGTYTIDWEAPPTANPDGLLGSIFMRVQNPDGSTDVQFDAGFGLDPNGREFGFRDDATDARLRGVVVIEPADAVDAQATTENVIGIAFSGDNLTDGEEYSLLIEAPDGQSRTVTFTAGGGGGSAVIGPEETTFADNELEFTYTVTGPEFDNVSSGPPVTEEPPEEHPDFGPVTGTRTNLFIVEPAVEIINGAPEIELVASSVAAGPNIHTFEVRVEDATTGEPLPGQDVEWQLILSGEVQTPGPRLLPNEITISADATQAETTYEIEMGRDSRIQATDTLEDGEDAVSADGMSATGSVGLGDSDTYRFLGSIFDFNVEGDVSVTVNGQTVEQATLNADEITIQGTNTFARYQFLVEGETAEVRPARGLSSEDSISPDGRSVEGAVRAGRDTYRFAGSVSGFTPVDGSVEVFINGTQIDPATISDLPNEIVVEGTGELARYQFESSGRLQLGRGISSEDTVSGSTAIGAVRAGRDIYRFSGEIVNFLNDGSVRVFVNGVDRTIELSNPADRLTIDGLGEFTSYDFAVTGEIAPTRRLTAEDSISADAKSASGAVRRGSDAYMFSGAITTLDMDSRARVDVNPSDGTITVAGKGPFTSYHLVVTGELQRTSSLTGEDSISADGRSADGAIRRGFDTYLYTGEVREVTLDNVVSMTVAR